jgi:hypothetical protein
VAKTAPSVDNIVSGQTAASVLASHQGHRITKVGSFSDNNEQNRGNMIYDVFYCQTDHKLFVI